MLDLDTICNSRMQEYPYRWVLFENLIPKSQLKELLNSFPHEKFGEKHSIMIWDEIEEFDSSTNLSLVWQTLVNQLHSPAYRACIAKLAGLNLEQDSIRIFLRRLDSTANTRPHTDSEGITLTHLFYFNEDWDTEWGGSFQVLLNEQPESVVREIPPSLGNSVVLVRSDPSWHQFAPISPHASQHRLSVLVRFYDQHLAHKLRHS